LSGTGYVVLTMEYRKVGRRWTAHCRELGTATFGRTLKDAEERISEAVLLHLNTLEDVGERERFFEEHSIQVHRTRPRKAPCVPTDVRVFTQTRVQRVPDLITA